MIDAVFWLLLIAVAGLTLWYLLALYADVAA